MHFWKKWYFIVLELENIVLKPEYNFKKQSIGFKPGLL